MPYSPHTDTVETSFPSDVSQISLLSVKADETGNEKFKLYGLTGFISRVLSGLGISNISGLQSALDSKSNTSHGHTISGVTGLQSALDGKQSQSSVLDNFITAYNTGSAGQVPRKTVGGFELYTPASGSTGGITLSDLSASAPLQYNNGTGAFSFNSSGFLQTGSTLNASNVTTGTLPDSVIPGSITRDSELSSAISALTKASVGLGNVDNTSDANKPISTATQTALDGKQPLDTDLTAIAALTTTAFGRGFLDLADAAAGRTKLSLGTAATAASIDFATAAQGAKADSALQPAAIGATVQGFDSDLSAIALLTTTAFGRNYLELADAAAARAKTGAQQDLAAITTPQSFNDKSIHRYSTRTKLITTTTYTLTAADNGLQLVFSNSSAITVTVPSGLVWVSLGSSEYEGFGCDLVQGGSGQVSIAAGSGVTVSQRESKLKLAGQHAIASLRPTGVQETYRLTGDLVA